MALWTSAANRGGGRALCLTIPAALPRPIASRFTQVHSFALHFFNPTQFQEANPNNGEHGQSESADNDGSSRPGNMAGFVAEKAKKGTRKAAEMVFEKGESTAEGKKESWGYVKETTQKIKDDLLGDEHDETTHHHGCDKND